MRIVLNEIQKNTIVLLMFGLLVIGIGNILVHDSSICIKSLPLNSNIFWNKVPGIDILVDYINVVIEVHVGCLQEKVIL